MRGKRNIKRIDLDILERVIIALYDLGKAKRTIISRNANMSYDKCQKYLDYLETSGFAKKETDDQGFLIFSLTSVGIGMAKKNLTQKFEQELLINKNIIRSVLS